MVWVTPAGRAVKRRRASIAKETRREPRSRANPPRQRAAPSCCVLVTVRHAFPSLCRRLRAKEESENPRANNRIRTRPPRPVGHRPSQQDTGPAVKTSSPRLSPRDAQCAVGGIRTWGENPGRRASSPTTVLPFGPSARADVKKPARTPPRAPARPPPKAVPDPHQPCPPPESLHSVSTHGGGEPDYRAPQRYVLPADALP